MLKTRKSGVSLAVIVRDEEASLPGCLSSTSGLFDETIVVDTGSVDRTREVARSFGATVVDFPWCDDFSAARNMALSRCTCDYIFWLDADEVLTRTSKSRLSRLLRSGLDSNTVYIMPQISHRPDGLFGFAEVLSPRLFPNRRGIRWSRRVNEGIPAVRALGLTSSPIDLYVNHLGFAQPATLRRKLLRNKRLLEIELADRSDDPVALFNLALTRALIGTCASSLDDIRVSRHDLEKLLEKERGPLDPDLEANACALLAHTCRALGNIVRSLEICEQWRLSRPSDMGLIHVEAFLLRDLGMWEKVESLYAGLPNIQAHTDPRNSCDGGYIRLVSAKIGAAYYFEETGKFCKAFLIWAELVRDSAGMFDAGPGLRRTARRILRDAILNPRDFLNQVRHLREGSPSQSSASPDPMETFSQ